MKNYNSVDFVNFVCDCFINSHDNKDIIYDSIKNLNYKDRKENIYKFVKNKEFYKKIFLERVKFLSTHINLSQNDIIETLTKVQFHPKFGWIVSNKRAKAYLGKYSIYGNPEITIGNRTYLSGFGIIRGNGKLNIGSYCSFATGMYLNLSNENQPIDYPASIGFGNEARMIEDNYLNEFKINYCTPKENKVDIGNDVWMGKDVSIFTGLKIGHGAVIGTKALVTNNCVPFGIYAGIPAKFIRFRFSEKIIEEILEIKWWNWSEERIKLNGTFFRTDLSKYKGSIKDIIY